MSVAPGVEAMDRNGIRRIGLNGENDKPYLDVNFIAKGAVLTAGKNTYVLNPLGINACNILCGKPSIVYEEPGRTGIEVAFTKGGCCGKPHYVISKMSGMKLLGIQDEKHKIGHTVNMKVGLCAKGPYYGINDATNKKLEVGLWNDAGFLKLFAPLKLVLKQLCEGCGNCSNLIKGRVTRNVHQPIFQPIFDEKGKKITGRKQIGIITHSYVMAPISCFQAMPYRFLHMRVEVTDQEWRDNASDDDFVRLAGFVITTTGGEFELVNNFLAPAPDPKRGTYTWAAGTGFDMGLNQWITYTDVKYTIMNGMMDIGNLMDKLIALIKGVGKKAKSLMDDGKKKMAAGMSDAKAKAQAKMAAMRGGEETV